MCVLDTSVVSGIRKATRADLTVRPWAEQTSSSLFWLSTITLLELEIGVLQIERRDAAQGALLRHWLERSVPVELKDRMLPVDVAIARASSALHVPNPRPERDALIAAIAQAHGLTVVTRNTADFDSLGVAVLDPWPAPGG